MALIKDRSTQIALGLIYIYQLYFILSVDSPQYLSLFLQVSCLNLGCICLQRVFPPTQEADLSCFDGLSDFIIGLLLIVVIPFVEECLFRYYLPTHLSWVLPISWVELICSIAFGLIHLINLKLYKDIYHLGNLMGIGKQAIFTCLLGLLICQSQSFILGMFLHMHYNSMGILIGSILIEEPQSESQSLNCTDAITIIEEKSKYVMKRCSSFSHLKNEKSKSTERIEINPMFDAESWKLHDHMTCQLSTNQGHRLKRQIEDLMKLKSQLNPKPT